MRFASAFVSAGAIGLLLLSLNTANAVARNDGTKGDPADIPAAVQFGNTTNGYDCSGTIIGGGMYVITAAHCISQGNDATKYKIKTQDGTELMGMGTVAIDL